jgi:hypothetical protein
MAITSTIFMGGSSLVSRSDLGILDCLRGQSQNVIHLDILKQVMGHSG